MRLRDRLDVIVSPDGALVRENVPAWVGYQSTALMQDARLQTTEVLRAIVKPALADVIVAGTHAIRWRGTAYPVVGVMVRMKRGRPHHVTLELERVSG